MILHVLGTLENRPSATTACTSGNSSRSEVPISSSCIHALGAGAKCEKDLIEHETRELQMRLWNDYVNMSSSINIVALGFASLSPRNRLCFMRRPQNFQNIF